MSDREFWILIRQALLIFISAIEKRYQLGKYAAPIVVEIQTNDTLSHL